MVNENSIADAGAYGATKPNVRRIGTADLIDALAKGLGDFKAMPTHIVFLCLIYPIVTLIFARAYSGHDILPLVFPLLAGYTLIGPLAATGMYELSRRREKGLDFSRSKAFHVLRRHSARSIGLLGAMLMVIYIAWLVTALNLWEKNFGTVAPVSIQEFATQVFLTADGWELMIVGSGVGFLFAVVVFSVSVVSFPMLMDRDVGVVMAVQTSIKAVLKNPVTMGMWGFIVAGFLLVGSLPFFVGLCIVLPVLGHSTWHLYRKVIEHD